jgi:hypothetical protein
MRHATTAIIACFHLDKTPIKFVNIPTTTAIANAAIDFVNLCPKNKNTKISYLKKDLTLDQNLI